ncbi:hypothetical protein [Litoreibacter roseus]|uniref:Lipid kinase n=1 Tax=Litoreibacter roseus TaxID=2601869 RepID=A0A6N6JCH0_9RHOB|nr:hypothetical protein [Litoreibacter roseus]GFE63784.1 lipid kinase [Litoreibacter roseus]
MHLALIKRTLLLLLATCFLPQISIAEEDTRFRLAWTDFPSARPFRDLKNSELLGLLESRYDLRLDILKAKDKAEISYLYRTGAVDLMTTSNVDLLTMAAIHDDMPLSIVLFPTDVSDGADALLLRDSMSIDDLPGARIGLRLNSTSHYLLLRTLDSLYEPGMRWPILFDLEGRSMVDALETGRIDAVVTTEPLSTLLRNALNMSAVSDSADFPGEIVDLVVIRKDVYQDRPKLAQLVIEGWYHLLARRTEFLAPAADDLMGDYGPNAQYSVSGLSTISSPEDGIRVFESGHTKAAMLRAKAFVDQVNERGTFDSPLGGFGIRFPDGTTIGDPNNVRIEFASEYLLKSRAQDMPVRP